ncbi:GrpB family protein [Alkalicoccus chagannorensis]|uniref:GrpB family protein n=1 Tax=Alkalicoccus chagannorensis TaxID=427072 RepID=UPI00040CF406|nr:GrpB family protein [Alkalicoccus chagannorensis]
MEQVKLHPYDPTWKEMFLREKEALEAVFKGAAVIEHIGSTAIPAMRAKPVIDIAAGVDNVEKIETHRARIENIGYTFVEHEAFPERRFFRKGTWRAGTHHLHVYEWESEPWRRQLLFRDYLLRHPEVRQQYEEIKQLAAIAHPHDRQAYTESKSSFIASVLREAEAEQKEGDA